MASKISTSSIKGYNEFIAAGLAAGQSLEDLERNATFYGVLDPKVEGQPRTGRTMSDPGLTQAEANALQTESERINAPISGDLGSYPGKANYPNYGGRIGTTGPWTMEVGADADGDGIEDWWQTGPGQRSQQPRSPVGMDVVNPNTGLTGQQALDLLKDPNAIDPRSGGSLFPNLANQSSIVAPGSLAVINSTLRRWGFNIEEIGGLSSWIQSQLQAGINVESVLILIYDQPDFQSRFPGMKAAVDAGFAAVSPDDYIEYEDGLREYIDQYLPSETVGNLDTLMTTLLGGNISIEQVKNRLQIAYDEILNAPVDVKSWFLQEYGEGADAMLATVLLDPDQSFTDLEQTAKEAYTQAAASEILSNVITKDTASKIASLGYTQESQYRQFTNLAKQEFLYLEKLTETDDLRIAREGVESAFGVDADAAMAVARREEERLSEFSGGGGAYTGTAITGFGAINA